MESTFERVCCQTNVGVLGDKLGIEKCIAQTDAFSDVCLNTNVLEAALGAWLTFTDEPLDVDKKSYRFISYRQYIYWVFGRLGKNIRKVVPSCAVQKIRATFPAEDGVYVPFKDT